MSSDEEEPDIITGTFRRGMRLAALPAGHAARATFGIGRRLVGTPAANVAENVQRRTAEQIFSVLGQLKGGAMKFGQAMSIFEAALPPEVAGPYREALTKLQDSAPPMPAATVRRLMAREFGPNWSEQFVEFDETPVAAASIGQVHRATWVDGQGERHDVAVKLQYPGAGEAIRSDLRQISRLARVFGTFLPGIDVKAMTQELQERISEELDYNLEAGAQNVFAAEFEGHPDVFVPYCLTHTERALVSHWVEAEHSLAELIKSGSQEERDRIGAVFVRFLFTGPARIGLLHADPHPGNFRVMADGRLAVIDYGSVARLPEGLPPIVGQLLRAATEGDYERVIEGLREEGFIRPGTKIDIETMRTYIEPLVDPAMTEEFSFSREWLQEQRRRITTPSKDGLASAVKLNIPREYLLIQRVWMGGVGILCQLEATAPFRSIVAESLPGFADDLQD